MRIEEGRLTERVCRDCGGTERRAFGESVSDRGELASYAIGWTSGHDDQVGHMSVGIGVGNPGGGTFHMDVWVANDDWAFGLVDQPFEKVPQGGPDLTRNEALAHTDLEYIWFVANNVMEHDRRAMWMEHWLSGEWAFVTPRVNEVARTARWVARDHDGRFQMFEAPRGDTGEPVVIHLYHALDADPSLVEILDLEPGDGAERETYGGSWVRERLDPGLFT